jgi:hypothetical protein
MVEEIDNQQQNSVVSRRGCLLLILLLGGVDLQYLAPLSLCYSLTVAQVNVIESTCCPYCYVV